MNTMRTLKEVIPPPLKSVAEVAIERYGAASASSRPPPDFVVIGAKRGGTTTLWRLLLDHPQVMPMVPAAKNRKGVHYFDERYEKSLSWYLGHFPSAVARRRHRAATGGCVVGEASPNYLFDPRVPQRVAAALPEVKLVVSLRDPVARAHSHYKERVKAGVESLPFEEALRAEDARLAGELDRMMSDARYYSRAWDWYSYRARGHYADQLALWLQHFARESVMVIKAEALYNDQASAWGRLQAFLGLDVVPAGQARHENDLTRAGSVAPATREMLHSYFESHNQRLAQLLGGSEWSWD